MRTLLLLLATTVSTCFAGCLVPAATTSGSASTQPGSPGIQYTHAFQPDLPVSSPPFRQVHANWKQRIDQPYVYVEFFGSYTETGRLLPLVHQAMKDQGLEPDGPPFALFYDDPGQVAAERLRSRACVPVGARVHAGPSLNFDVLPSTTVVYAFAAGAYPDVPQAYPGLFSYMSSSGWIENGPIRETYLVSPAQVQSFSDLLTEIQIPVTYGS